MAKAQCSSDRIRLHVAIRDGFQQIERDKKSGLVGSRGAGSPWRAIPRYETGIKRAQAAFQYLSSPLLHDLNRINMLLDAWGEKLDPIPCNVIRELIENMESWIESNDEKFKGPDQRVNNLVNVAPEPLVLELSRQ